MPDDANAMGSAGPVLQALQYGGGGGPSAGESVNLFRGSLAFPHKILSLPGRNGLSVDVQLLYESTVGTVVDGWNLDRAPDIAGVGWKLPFEAVVAAPALNASWQDSTFFLIVEGQAHELRPVPLEFTRARLPLEYASWFAAGSVHAALRDELAVRGIALSEAACVERVADEWHILDDRRGARYRLVAARELEVRRLGQTYELQNFRFWQVVYDAAYELWEVVRENGTSYTYGGSGEVLGGAAPHVVQWGIKWGNWIGPSTEADDQARHPMAWNLARIENLIGNTIRYAYRVTEQRVGNGALTYTKECQVSRIENDLGWACVFSYLPQIYDADTPEGPKEYLDPHKDPTRVPDTTPDAYQSRYTTVYLDSVALLDPSGTAVMTQRFEYYPLKNLSGDTKGLACGATYKRYLKSITQSVADAGPQPSSLFEYEFGDGPNANRGALVRVSYPSGGSTTYTYTAMAVGSDGANDPGARNLRITNPFGTASKAAVRSWLGPDYVVNAWYDDSASELRLNVYTWLGRWHPWRRTFLVRSGTFDVDGIQVGSSADVFLLSVPYAARQQTDVLLFNRRHLCNGQWDVLGGDVQPAVHRYETNHLAIVNGANFFLALDQDNARITRFDWKPLGQDWTIDELAVAETLCTAQAAERRFYAAAGQNYHLLMCYDPAAETSRLSIFFKDEALAWQLGSRWDTSAFSIPRSGAASFLNFAASDSFVAVAWVTGFSATSPPTFDYALGIISWDSGYRGLRLEPMVDVDPVTFQNMPWAMLPSLGPFVTDNTIAGSGPNACYYDGKLWRAVSTGVKYRPAGDPAQQYYWFAYSPTAILYTENTSSGVFSAILTRDPSHAPDSWATQVLEDVTPAPSDRYRRGYPTLRGTYVTQSTRIYNQSVFPDWENLGARLLADLALSECDTTTVIDQAPNFLAFMTVDDEGTPLATHVVFFRNGDLIRDAGGRIVTETFAGQQMFRLMAADHRYRTALSGRLPALPLGFVTLPAAEHDNAATEITLHRYGNHSLRGPVTAFVVSTAAVDDGYGVRHTAYRYTDVSAATDTSGTVVRFQTATEYDGCSDPARQAFGWTVTHFFNGLPADAIGLLQFPLQSAATAAYSMLDGMIIRKEQYATDGTLVTSEEYVWQVATEVAADPGARTMRALAGGLPQIASSSSTQDGVTSDTSYGYSLSSGNTRLIATGYFGSTGERIEKEIEFAYAYEHYPEMWDRNILSPVAQLTSRARGASERGFRIQALSVQTFKRWPSSPTGCWDVWESFTATRDDAAAFDGWNGGGPPDGWLRVNSIGARSAQGAVATAIDGDGLTTVNLFDDADILTLATVKAQAASRDAIVYESFESYQPTLWRFDGASPGVTDEDSFTGGRCCEIAAPGTLSRSITMPALPAAWVLSFWCKTPAHAPTAATVQITSSSGAEVRHDVAPTGGKWRYQQWIVDADAMPPGDAVLKLKVASPAPSSGWLLRVDDILFVPLESAGSAFVYDAQGLYQTAVLGANGTCVRRFFNAMHAHAATAGPDENVAGFTTAYTATAATGVGGTYPTAAPGFELTVSGQRQGWYDEFKSDALADYTVIGTAPQEWLASQRRLRFAGASSDPLGARVRRRDFESDSIGIYIRVLEPSSRRTALGTGTVFVVWTGGTWQLCEQSGGVVRVLEERELPFGQEWILCIFDGAVVFLVDGTRVFTRREPAWRGTRHGVELGAQSPASFGTLVVADALELSFEYLDGLSRPIQTAHMESADSAIVVATLYDTRGKPGITVEPSRVTTTHVPDPLAFYDGYVTNGGPDGGVWQDAPLEGPAADLYHPECAGYPFTREAYEAAPTARVRARGLPGREFAIAPAPSGGTNPHVTTCVYGTNDGTDRFLYPLPKASYLRTVRTDPNGNRTVVLADTAGNRFARIDEAGDGSATRRSSQVFDAFGRCLASIPPSFYASGGGSSIPPSATTWTYDFLNRRVGASHPDRGKTRYVYDQSSRLRFAQDAAGLSGDYIQYFKYDGIGRLREEGWIPYVWNPQSQADLERRASTEPDWPSPATTWSLRQDYDRADTAGEAVGNLVRSVSNNRETSEGDVTVQYSYDRFGNVLTVEQHIADTPLEDAAIRYTYNAARMCLTSSETATDLVVSNSYNPLRQLVSVEARRPQESHELVRYSYAPTGEIADMVVRLSASAAPFRRTFDYLPPRWLSGAVDPMLGESLRYTDGGYDNAGYFDGTVARQTFTDGDGGPRQRTVVFEADYQGQLVRAESDSVDQGWTIDVNGNFTAWRRGADELIYRILPDANRIEEVTSGGRSLRSFEYTPVGNLSSTVAGTDTMSIGYDRATNLPRSVSRSSGGVTTAVGFRYEGGQKRAAKEVRIGSDEPLQSAYFNGLAALPVLRVDSDGAAAQVSRFVRLPQLTAVYTGGRLYAGLPDHVGSIRTVLDDAGAAVGRYAYDLYGATTIVVSPPVRFDYLFTGQEYDREIGLYNLSARLYDPALGRFVMVDPILVEASPYSYGSNNPILYVDPTGTISLGAIIGIVAGGLMIAGGIVLTVATMGAAAPVVVAGSIVAAAAMGAGVSSVTYSITHRNDWNAKTWGIGMLIGAGSGAVAAIGGIAVSLAAGAAASAIAAAVNASMGVGRLALVQLTAGIVGGAASGAGGNALGALTANGLSDPSHLSRGLGTAAWQGAVFGAVGGFAGGIGGLRAAVAARYRPAPGAAANFQRAEVRGASGLTGLVATERGRVHLEDVANVPGAPNGMGSAHGQQAIRLGIQDVGTHRFLEDGTPVPDVPGAIGFSIKQRLGSTRASIAFGSTTLNDSKFGSRQLPMSERIELMSSLRFAPELRIRPVLYPNPETNTITDRAVAFLLRTPLY